MRGRAQLAAVLLLTSTAAAAAQTRIAFVVGNSTYSTLTPLANPGLDAARLAQTLGENGFEVISCDGKRPGCFNLTARDLQLALGTLQTKAKGADLALVFYAGHGMEAKGGNVMAPIDSKFDCTTGELAGGVPIDAVLAAIAPSKAKNRRAGCLPQQSGEHGLPGV